MDIVITYVNSKDPEFVYRFSKAKEKYFIKVDPLRWRSYNNLYYLFRSIAKYAPFVNNIFLVVQSESQVPIWINRDKVKIVTHDQIIPKEYLPTYNSTTIEAFLYKIPNLSEEFAYFNDDMYLLNPMSESDFFINGKPVFYMKRFKFSRRNIFRVQCYNSYKLLADYYNIDFDYIVKPCHIYTTFLKSVCEKVFNLNKDKILKSLTRERSVVNFTQYLYMYDNYFRKDYYSKLLKYRYMSLTEIALINSKITDLDKVLCINDSTNSIDFNYCINKLNQFLNKKLFEKCIYEL